MNRKVKATVENGLRTVPLAMRRVVSSYFRKCSQPQGTKTVPFSQDVHEFVTHAIVVPLYEKYLQNELYYVKIILNIYLNLLKLSR